MKAKSIFISLLFILLCSNNIFSRDPNTNYLVKYVEDDSHVCHLLNRRINLTTTRIYVYNTASGNKYWDCEYLGITINYYKGVKQRWHKYFLTNKHVFFYISDNKNKRIGGVYYYTINFDGEIEYALDLNVDPFKG